jgi:hypothetical protein
MQLLSAPLIRKYKCGLFIVPQDFGEVDLECTTYFGDQPISFKSFNPFFCKYLGGRIELLFQGLEISRDNKVIHLIEINWFRFNSSCYMNWNFFTHFQSLNGMNPDLNMCGQCWKCKIDIKMIRSNNSLFSQIKLK